MATTYDLTTAVGQVRLQISDTDVADAIFSDEELQVFLDANSDDVLLASAQALRSIAASAARMAKLRKTLNFTADTRQVAESLLKTANELQKQANSVVAFGNAQLAVTPDNVLGIVHKKALREG